MGKMNFEDKIKAYNRLLKEAYGEGAETDYCFIIKIKYSLEEFGRTSFQDKNRKTELTEIQITSRHITVKADDNAKYSLLFTFQKKEEIAKLFSLIKNERNTNCESYYHKLFWEKVEQYFLNFLEEEYPYEEGFWKNTEEQLVSVKEELRYIIGRLSILSERIDKIS